MMNDNGRKSATKLLLVNWSRFSHICISLEGSTLFTGVNGSGKSTVLDAMTYMLTGNTQFNKAALDRDRNVISYVRGDTKSEGKNRFIREGEVICYIAMEFWSPVEKQYLVTGVCIEYVNETSNTKKWFVFKDTRMEDCVFYTEEEKKITVYPRYRLMVKGKKIPAGEFMNRDRGTEQVLRALGLRCGVDKYRAKLIKMMAFNPENNIDKFIQECVLDEHLVRSMEDIREHRKHYDDAKMIYEELSSGKRQLEIVQQKIADYEGAERRYEIRRILLLYQEMKSYQENLEELQYKIKVNKAKISQLKNQLEEQREKRDKALERKVDAQRNHLLSDADKVMRSIEENIRSMEKEREKYENDFRELQILEENIGGIFNWFNAVENFNEKEIAILLNLSATAFAVDEKINLFIRFKNLVNTRKNEVQEERVRKSDRIRQVRMEREELQEKINRLESDVLSFDRKYEEAKKTIKRELEKLNIQTEVRLFAELVRSVDRKWQPAIETFLGKRRFDLVVDGKYCGKVMEIAHRLQLRDIKVIITDQLPQVAIVENSAASMLEIPNEYGRRYANYILNGIHLCEDMEELHRYPKGGLMKDGTLARSFTMGCMSMGRTQFYMGKEAINQQLQYAKEDMDRLCKEEEQLAAQLEILNRQICDIERVNWDEDNYIFDVQARKEKKEEEIRNKREKAKNLKNTPGFSAALQEKENADKEYENADREYVKVSKEIGLCEENMESFALKYQSGEREIERTKKEYEEAIFSRLELRGEVTEMYDRLRAKSGNVRVITPKSVENFRAEKENAVRKLEEEQRRYWHIIGQGDEKYGVGYISRFREQYRDIANVKIEEAKKKLEEQQQILENAFMVDFVAEMNEAIREAREEIDELNRELKNIPFGKDTYQFMMVERPDRMVFFELCKNLENYMNSMELYRGINLNDEEMEYNIRRLMDTILEEENEEEYTDYRKYFKYDMKIRSRQDGDETTADLSKKQGSASNGEKQTPYFIILAASLLQCYPKNSCCARLAFIDEAFSALSRERIEQMVKFFEDNRFQVIYAAPPEKIDSIGSYINSTVSLCMKGKYTWAVEGMVKPREFAALSS